MIQPLRIRVGDLMRGSTTIDPRRFADEMFDLYSIPAFDAGRPDEVSGSDIGSAKQIVEPNDVLLSRIVPHIRRAWIVGPENARRQIASGEWIVFCSEKMESRYLRHLLTSNEFHAGFMLTVAGVGGSLLRARPKHVAEIEIPFPPLSEQRRIAAILDQADALRAKRRAALAQLDEMAQAIFTEMFGDVAENSRKWAVRMLGELCSPKQWPTITSQDLQTAGYPVYGANGQIGYYSKFNHPDPTVLVTCRGATCGTINISPPYCYVTGNAMALDDPKLDLINIRYLASILERRGLADAISGTAQPQITRQSIIQSKIVVPPLDLQDDYRRRIESLTPTYSFYRKAVSLIDDLFASLRHRAFTGAL